MEITDLSLDDASAIYNIVEYASASGNMKHIQDLLLADDFRGIPKDQREAYAFSSAYHIFTSLDNDKTLRYLIFDYKVSESNTINCLSSIKIDTRVKKMFEMRKLNQGLNNELINEKDNTNKIKIKI